MAGGAEARSIAPAGCGLLSRPDAEDLRAETADGAGPGGVPLAGGWGAPVCLRRCQEDGQGRACRAHRYRLEAWRPEPGTGRRISHPVAATGPLCPGCLLT